VHCFGLFYQLHVSNMRLKCFAAFLLEQTNRAAAVRRRKRCAAAGVIRQRVLGSFARYRSIISLSVYSVRQLFIMFYAGHCLLREPSGG
jgi:hypothetical protein